MSKTILLVSDNATDIASYSAALRAAGYQSIATLIGTDRVLHSAQKPALIVLDCASAGAITLRELVLLLKEIYSGVPVLMCCSSGKVPEDIKRLVDAFVEQGDPAELIAAVRKITGGQAFSV